MIVADVEVDDIDIGLYWIWILDSRRVVLSCSQSAARLTTGILRQAGLALHLLLARIHLGEEEGPGITSPLLLVTH